MKTKYYYYGGAIIIIALLTLLFTTEPPGYDNIDTPRAVFGNEEASVKIIEFADFQCPACGAAHPVIKEILSEYGDLISYEMHHFPLRSIHPFAQKAAEASECANDQGKFFEYADLLYANQRSLRVSNLKQYAAAIDLDTESFNACLDSGAKTSRVNDDYNEATLKGVSSTPSIFVNKRKAPSYQKEILVQIIESELAKFRGTQSN